MRSLSPLIYTRRASSNGLRAKPSSPRRASGGPRGDDAGPPCSMTGRILPLGAEAGAEEDAGRECELVALGEAAGGPHDAPAALLHEDEAGRPAPLEQGEPFLRAEDEDGGRERVGFTRARRDHRSGQHAAGGPAGARIEDVVLALVGARGADGRLSHDERRPG